MFGGKTPETRGFGDKSLEAEEIKIYFIQDMTYFTFNICNIERIVKLRSTNPLELADEQFEGRSNLSDGLPCYGVHYRGRVVAS